MLGKTCCSSSSWQVPLWVSLQLLVFPTCFCQREAVQNPDEPQDPLRDLNAIARNVLLLVSLLALTLIINNFVQKRGVPIPEAICTVVIGVVAGGIVKLLPSLKNNQIQQLENSSATEFMVVFIAPIIFAEGYGLKSHQFFDNITRILCHAFLGTLLSTLVVGFGVYYLPPLTGYAANLSLAECLAFGALISSTDPVTTLAIFKDQQMVENGLSYLYYTVLGESILNDAVGLTLFAAFGDVVVKDQVLNAASVVSIGSKFLITFVGSLAIGVTAGIATALILKFARLGSGANEEEHFYFNVPEIGVTLVLAYLPFLIAEACGFSGIVAIMFCGIAMRHYAHYNMTHVTRQVFLPTIELIASMSETYVFLLLGVGVFLLDNHYSFSFISWAVLFCLLGRAVHVYPFSWVINRSSSSHRLNLHEQHVCWYAGLRGAVAFMCALSFPTSETVPLPEHRGYILCTTVVLILASMVLLGWPTTAVLRCLDIRACEDSRLGLPSAGVEAGGEGAENRTVESAWRTKLAGRSKDISEKIKHILMTSDAIIQREANNQMAAELRSQRNSSAFLARNTPRQSAGLQGDSPAASGRVSEPFLHYNMGSPPQMGVPWQWSTQGRPSAPVTTGFMERSDLGGHVDSAIHGRPSAPPRLQAYGISRVSEGPWRRSARMICNP